MTTRREKQRKATIDEIKSAALDQIAQVGGPSLSMRGIARSIGMSPAGLYRYYDSRDHLLTDLIADAYNDLARAVESGITSAQDGSREKFEAAMLAYRRWALDHTNRFLLIFGTPIPGYVAPEDGPTVEGNRRIGQAFFSIGIEAWRRGQLEPETAPTAPTKGERTLAKELDPSMPAELVPMMIGSWAHFHGVVTLEILGQLDWLYPDDADTFFAGQIDQILETLGLSRSSARRNRE